MARFNQSTTKPVNRVVNHEGETAYTIPPEMELYSLVCTASMQNSFYESTDQTIERMRRLIMDSDPLFVAQLAVYAREKMYLRSVPLVLSVEMAKTGYRKHLRRVVSRIIQRPDEMTEILAYYQIANQREGIKKLGKLAKSIQKGIADAFLKFDEYQLAKYNRDGEIKLKDALFLSHAKPANEGQATLFKKLIDGTLEVPYTWEVELSKAGQEGREKKDVWEELIASKKLGYMALLRNLRNILEAQVSQGHIEQVCTYLSSKEAVIKSRQFPFRFFSAFRELQQTSSFSTGDVLEALEKAVIHSVENLKGFDADTRVVVACDVSGSMESSISLKSTVQLFDVGLILGMLLQNKCKQVITGMFGDIWKPVPVPKMNVLRSCLDLHGREGEVGYSTNGHLVLQYLLDNQIEVDKIMMFTDCQMWNSAARYQHSRSRSVASSMEQIWNQYKQRVPKARLYLFDLKGYGSTPLNLDRERNVFLIAGWNNEVFNVMDAIENGEDALAQVRKIVI